MKFKEMNLVELMEFWKSDWEKESPRLENPTAMGQWDSAVNNAVHKSSELEILQALHVVKDEEYIETIEGLREFLFDSFAGTLMEEVKELKTSIQVLLREHENEQASITIGQLNRLKGGLR